MIRSPSDGLNRMIKRSSAVAPTSISARRLATPSRIAQHTGQLLLGANARPDVTKNHLRVRLTIQPGQEQPFQFHRAH
jgi:hypothetical protein